jgi:hypothetical protein
MFAKLARFNGLGRRHAPLSAAKTAYANDNHPVRRRTAVAQRARRQILICGWRQVAATGRLECFWQVEPAGAAVAEEPGISRMMRSSASAPRRIVTGRRRRRGARLTRLSRVRPMAALWGRNKVRDGLNNIQG